MSEVGLYLADGTSWPGVSVGAAGAAVGEAVFTTAMTGYQEALTDPSFARQILAFTAPMIGNYGVEDDVSESRRVQPTALICHEARNYAPNGRQGLLDWLRAGGIVALSGLDTRALVRHLRERGAMPAVACGEGISSAQALDLLRAEPPMAGRLLAGEVSGELAGIPPVDSRCHVVVLDYGAKASIVRLLEQAGATVTVLPHDATAAQVDALAPDGVLLANGPGDPGSMDAHVAEVRAMVAHDRPLYGICLGHQLLGRALGLETFKLPFGHRGANHPVYETASGRVLVTSQNHGFAVAAPANGDGELEVTHRSLYDGTVEGLRLRGRPVWSMQFHPEASPGPHDAREKLAEFVEACVGRGR
ncbi:MAG: carbamoyl-phosphate synthase small subunit [Gaiellales bacterium]|nr:carbamoyl-phosphate synthase small subunit [Gaiellales bacterium]